MRIVSVVAMLCLSAFANAAPVQSPPPAPAAPSAPAAPAPADAPPAAGGLGATARDAIEVCRPEGQRQYLARLVCPGGEHPAFSRTGSFGERNPVPAGRSEEAEDALFEQQLSGRPLRAGEVDHHIVDGYEVVCPDSRALLFFDMYHCGAPRPTQAPAGFTLVD